MPLAGLLVAAGTTALSILIVVSITGGFTIDAGPLHLSAHRLLPPLIVAIVAFACAAAFGRQRLHAALAAVATRLETHGLAIAVVLAAVTGGIGIAFGTYAVSGADAGGYISQADLLARGQLTFHEPLVQRASWPDASWTFAPLGFRPGTDTGEIVPTYPPGLPFAMLLASAVAGDAGPFLVAPLLGAICVLATFLLGARIHTPTAGVIAAAFMATSPVWLFQIVQPMSDVPAAAVWTLALLAATARPSGRGAQLGMAILCALAASAALLMRPNLFLLVLPVVFYMVTAPHEPPTVRNVRARLRPLLAFAVIVSSGIVVLAAIQWRLYGNPLASGHGAFSELFAAANTATNVRDYSVRLLRGEAPALIVAAAALVLGLAASRSTTTAIYREPNRPTLTESLRMLALVAVPLLICYLPYGVFPDWSYLRFLLPAFPAAFIAVGALATETCRRFPDMLRGPILVLALAACVSSNVMTARREGVFDLHVYESRYRTAGRYLDAVLPPNAVIVTSQQSASAHYYTRLPILRWDLLPADLDAALATLVRLGRHPVLLIEDWEEPMFRARFPTSTLTSLDWRSRAQFGTTTRVRYLDPSDREISDAAGPKSQALVTDRLP